MQRLRRLGFIAGAVLTFSLLASAPALAQDHPAAAAAPLNLHYAGAALGVGLVVIGAALGIGRFAAAAADGIARQPQAAGAITGAVNLPLFLLEGVAIIAEVVCLLVVLLK